MPFYAMWNSGELMGAVVDIQRAAGPEHAPPITAAQYLSTTPVILYELQLSDLTSAVVDIQRAAGPEHAPPITAAQYLSTTPVILYELQLSDLTIIAAIINEIDIFNYPFPAFAGLSECTADEQLLALTG
ncbi:hypothetical protein F2P81_018502 [Scophthalmus maximus]|uniref:Uncharacterized protein n=1 Tax=Scophthalmus maximus TaxID=52904 RepID=A0A6A4S8E1_SCOMX|nr:hypothetical protein F2P81_018502 [Scophthalmus maximus]